MLRILDDLYEKSSKGERDFTNLMTIIASDENLKLAYRNIKRNKGSLTAGIDGKTIKDVEKLTVDDYLTIMKKRINNYIPRKIRRVEIPKPNGKTRPLGIPSIWDRLLQQSILQVLEPICEAQFNKHSYGFRPNRSAHNAIADVFHRVTHGKLYYVVDIDIKGFFDNVNHSKLMRQIWSMGIRDKKLINIIRKMLKTPIVLGDGDIITPNKGTPQGGILSPLLANIVLNELDWWVSNQWETFPDLKNIKPQYDLKDGHRNRHNEYVAMSRTNLKKMFIVRYADDFKILCSNEADATKIYSAIIDFLNTRLKLEVSLDKSKITNLRKGKSEFLGFQLYVIKKNKGFTMSSRVCDKALERVGKELKEQIIKMGKPISKENAFMLVREYNSMVMGIHNYYSIAANVNIDMRKIKYSINATMSVQLKNNLLKKTIYKDEYKGKYLSKYMSSKQIRWFCGKIPIAPIGYIQHRKPMNLDSKVCKYTPQGREIIHKKQQVLSLSVLRYVQEHPVLNMSIEFNDNRISHLIAQKGKCFVMGWKLDIDDIYCHRKLPKELGGDDRYNNLVIVNELIHTLIHATNNEEILYYLETIKPNQKELDKINKLRKIAKLELI